MERDGAPTHPGSVTNARISGIQSLCLYHRGLTRKFLYEVVEGQPGRPVNESVNL